jgi:hypothetical protein
VPDNQGSIIDSSREFAVCAHIHMRSGKQFPMQYVTRAYLPLMKRPELEPNDSPASSAKFKNAWSATFTPPYIQVSA